MEKKVLFRHLTTLTGLCAIGISSVGITIHYTVQNRLRKTSTYKKALDIFFDKEEIINYLGKPIREGAIKVKEAKDNIRQFNVNVTGSKTKGILSVEYQIQPTGKTEIKKAEVKLNDSPDTIFEIYNIY